MTLSEYKRLEKEKLSKQRLKPLQKISNNFIDNTIAKNNLSALKTIFYLASILRNIDLNKLKEDELIDVTIDTKQMYDYTELTPELVRKNLKAMQETSITFINEFDSWEMGINLLPMYNILYNKRKIELKIFVKIAKLIIDVKRNYTFMNIKELMRLTNKHSIRMLGLLNKLNSYSDDIPKRKHLTLEDLNEFFGTKYRSFYELDKKILTPVKNELDSSSKLSFIYNTNFEVIGKGRPRFKNIIIDVIEQNSYQSKLDL